MSNLLLTTKLYIPPPRPGLVARLPLIARLNEGRRLGHRLTLVSAPAGFGKSSLLSAWAAQYEGAVAWLALDEGDNDPARFWVYVVAALQTVQAGLGEAALAALQSPQPPPIETFLTGLVNEIAALPSADDCVEGDMQGNHTLSLDSTGCPYVFVLDDYHLIMAQPIHDGLAFLIDHLPPTLHLVIATRADPPLPLPRLRARGQLTELRQRDLRFTAEEAAVFLNDAMGLKLSPQDIDALETRTEGWIAGLQMAALSLQGRPTTRSAFVQAFTGSHRFVLDYLVAEVLEQQPPALQDFLLKTSVLERLTGPLCDAVVGDREIEGPGMPPACWASSPDRCPNFADSQAVLEHLEAVNLFIVPLDQERRWYRYHRLFADLLQQRLQRLQPNLCPSLHRRASTWYERQGLITAAIEHSLAAEDIERAGILIEEHVEAILMRSEIATFLNWMEKLPDAWVRRRPTLCYYHAWALMMRGQSLDVVEQRLEDMTCAQDAEASPDLMAGRTAALRAYLMLFQADMHRAAALCRQALELLPNRDRFLRSVMVWILSMADLADSETQDGGQMLRDVVQMGRDVGSPLIAVTALCHQAKLQMRRGRLHQAREILERALYLATDAQGRRLPIASEALMGLGELAREWNDLGMAADYLTESIELAKQWSELAAFDAYYPLARVRLAQGDVEAAREMLETAQRIALTSKFTDVDDLLVSLQQAHFWISRGDVESALRWAEARGLMSDLSSEPHPDPDKLQDFVRDHLRKYEHLMLARLFILQEQAGEALDLLPPLLAQAQRLERVDLIIEIHILSALAHQIAGQDAEALAGLVAALSLAEPGGYRRVFLDAGAPMAKLLRQVASRSLGAPAGITPAYVANLMTAFGELEQTGSEIAPAHPQAQPLIDPLSERELDVLRLLATGLSNPEIADELYVAVSTIRSHCKSIYGKLDVHSRWDAVQRGQDLGLI